MTESPYTTGVNTPGHGTIGGETGGPAGAVNTERALTPDATEAGMNDSNARPQAEDGTWPGYPLRFDAGSPCDDRNEWCASLDPHEHGGFACEDTCPCRSDRARWDGHRG